MVRVYKKIMAFIVMIAFLLHYASAYAVYGAEDIAVISNVIMNVGANETLRNLTWYSDSLEDGEVRYAKNNILNGDSFPSDYSVSNAIAVSTATDGYWSYKATLTGLEENASYSYCIVVGDTVSDIYTFNTKSFADDFSFAFVTDPQVNSANDSTSWNDTLTKLSGAFSDISFVVSAGDQISSPTSETDYGYFLSDQLKSIAFAPSVGPGHDNASLYDSHFNLPNLSSGYGVTDTSSDYYYKYNDVLFMHLNAESNDYASHASFMENTIANNPDCAWKIVVIHYSFYTGGHHSSESAVRNCRNALAGKINELGVDLVLSGHDHLYARSKLMIGSNVVSDDVVVNDSATDPVGTLYLCGTSASGASYYDVESSSDDKFIASRFDDNCKGAVIFDVSETKLEMHSYFLDGNEPREFDSFVINKHPQKLRLNDATDMLEFMPDGEKERIPLVNAYAYSDAVVRVVNGSWSVSTDAGVTYQSLGIYSDENNYVIRINSQSGNWELSDDGGSSFTDTDICANRYTVTYVDIPGASFGDGSQNSEYNKRSITTPIPDPPVISLPKGSVSEGYLYEWSWEYYFSNSGIKATSFEYGNDYVAYLVCTKIPVSNIVRVGNATNASENIYNWKDAWEVAIDCYDESLCLVLEEDIVLSSTDAISFTVPVDVTLDLNGHSIDTSACSNAFVFSVGSSGANFRVESLREDGAVDAGSNNFIAVSSNSASKVNIWLGSSDSHPINVKSCKNLVFFSNNFKHKSTVNLNIYSGIYNVSESVAYITNIYNTSEKNIYNINAHNAEFRFSKSGAHLFVPRANGFYANSASSFTAEGCSFVNTFSQSSINLLKSDCWLGEMSFSDSCFDGVSIDGSVLAGIKNITFSENCTFKNSSATFKSNSLEFSADYMKTDVGCVVAHTDGTGSSAIEKRENTAAITWSNPIGYTEYWKKGTTPVYLGETSFTVNNTLYSLVVAEIPDVANQDRVYSFVSAEGYIYSLDVATNEWLISKDNGKTFQKIDGSEETGEEFYYIEEFNGVYSSNDVLPDYFEKAGGYSAGSGSLGTRAANGNGVKVNPSIYDGLNVENSNVYLSVRVKVATGVQLVLFDTGYSLDIAKPNIIFDSDNVIKVNGNAVGNFESNQWYTVGVRMDTSSHTADIIVDNKILASGVDWNHNFSRHFYIRHNLGTSSGAPYSYIDDLIIRGTKMPDENPEDCYVIVDGQTIEYSSDTDFSEILDSCDVSGSKDISILVNADFNLSTSVVMANIKDYTLNIDLNGHTLNMTGAVSFSSDGFNVNIYSSKEGGKLLLGSNGYFQPGAGGVITFGDEQLKNNLSIESSSRVVNLGQVRSGVVGINYIGSKIKSGAYGILRLNAKGANVITLDANIVDCEVTLSSGVIYYNNSSNLGSGSNGGLFDTDSVINIENSVFNCTASSPAAFFGATSQFKDRYYGKVFVQGCTFTNFVLNGDGIYSDSEISYTYNNYPQNLPDSYNPEECITIGKDCIFNTYGSTFDSSLTSFSSSNVSLDFGCYIHSENGLVKINRIDSFSVDSFEKSGNKIKVHLSIPQAGTYSLIIADYDSGKLNNVDIVTDTFECGMAAVESSKDITLSHGDKIMLWNNTKSGAPLCRAFEVKQR